ncbi:MAG: hypothetical protein ACR2GY_09460 [Phycisphaerales bacterium]
MTPELPNANAPLEPIDRLLMQPDDADAWASVETRALKVPGGWEQTARALRDELLMRLAVDDALAPAHAISLAESAHQPASHARLPIAHATLASRIGRFSGWATAACIGLVWAATSLSNQVYQSVTSDSSSLENGATLQPISNQRSDEILSQYKLAGAAEGRLIDELPKVLIGSQPMGDEAGRVQVLYLRRIVESAVVDSAIQLEEDGPGHYRAVPVNLERLVPSDSSL